MHAASNTMSELQATARWLGRFFTVLAAIMSGSAGWALGGDNILAAAVLAALFAGLTFAVAIMLPFITTAWGAGQRGMALALVACFVFAVGGELASHVAFGTSHRTHNIEGATLQNTRFEDQRATIKDGETNVAMWEARLATLEGQNAWVTTVTADALRAQARAEEHRGGCKAKCEAIKAQIAVAEEAGELRKQIEATRKVIAAERAKSAAMVKGESVALNQSQLFATVATGSLAPAASAMAWANIAIGSYVAMLSTMLGTLLNWLGFHSFGVRQPARPDDPKPGAKAPLPFVAPSQSGLSDRIEVHTLETVHTRDEGLRRWAVSDDVQALLKAA